VVVTGRPLRHPSGPGVTVSVRLAPAALAALDAYRGGLSRAAALERLLLGETATAQSRHPATHAVTPTVTAPIRTRPRPKLTVVSDDHEHAYDYKDWGAYVCGTCGHIRRA
jgi:hypothetical protein